jgi:hypothetical protein
MRLRIERPSGSASWDRQLIVLLLLLLPLAAMAALGLGVANHFGGPPTPQTPKIVSAPSSLTFATSAHFTFSDAGTVNAFMCSLDDAAAAYCGSGTSGSASYNGLTGGQHAFSVYALVGPRQSQTVQVDWRIEVVPAGRGSHPSRLGGAGTGNGIVTGNARVLDRVPPPVPVFTSTPSRNATGSSATFAFREPSASDFDHFECSFEGGAYYRCTSPQAFDRLTAGRHAFAVLAVDTAGNRSKDNQFQWTIAKPPAPFTIAGDAVGLLYPGGSALPVNLVFTNPNSAAIEITSVKVTVGGTSAAACGAGNFEVVHNLLTSPHTVVVPANSTRSLKALGIPRSQWPKLRMLRHGNQSGCERATVHLSYSGSAHS